MGFIWTEVTVNPFHMALMKRNDLPPIGGSLTSLPALMLTLKVVVPASQHHQLNVTTDLNVTGLNLT